MFLFGKLITFQASKFEQFLFISHPVTFVKEVSDNLCYLVKTVAIYVSTNQEAKKSILENRIQVDMHMQLFKIIVVWGLMFSLVEPRPFIAHRLPWFGAIEDVRFICF